MARNGLAIWARCDICGSALFSAFPIVRLYSSDATNRKYRPTAVAYRFENRKSHVMCKAGTTSIMRQRQESRFDDFAIQSLQPFLTHFLASSHSHTTITFQPIASSSACCLTSRSWLRSSFALQNSTFDFGTRVAFGQFSCICQKQPLMNTIVRYFGNTTSGCPGYRLSFLRNRRPFEKENCVPSFRWMCLCLGYAT